MGRLSVSSTISCTSRVMSGLMAARLGRYRRIIVFSQVGVSVGGGDVLLDSGVLVL